MSEKIQNVQEFMDLTILMPPGWTSTEAASTHCPTDSFLLRREEDASAESYLAEALNKG